MAWVFVGSMAENNAGEKTDAELLSELSEQDFFTTKNNHGETQRWQVSKTKEIESSTADTTDYRVVCEPVGDNDYPAPSAEFRADPNVSDSIQNVGSLAIDYSVFRGHYSRREQ